MSDNGNHTNLHIVMFPWLAFGHMIPYLELSNFLASKGHKISFISTPKNVQRLVKVVPIDPSHPINFIEISLPKNDPNLPENAEATSDLPNSKADYFKKAFDALQTPVTNFIESAEADWVIFDFAPHWLPSIAAKLGVSSAHFCVLPVTMISHFALVLQGGKAPESSPAPFFENFGLRPFEVNKRPDGIVENVSGVSDMVRAVSTLQGCDVLVVRSSRDFEPEAEWLRLLPGLLGKPVIPIGALPPTPRVQDETDANWLVIKEWLDKQEMKSVIYIAFGSEFTPNQKDTTQLALGLELSGLPFFWVWRRPNDSNDSDSDGLPAGFEERVNGRGIIWRSWAPQLTMLGHPKTGAYLTHCGWGSLIEALGLGCPLVTFPLVIEQPMTARILEQRKLGLEIPRDEHDGSFDKEAVANTLRKIVVDEEGEAFRTNAKGMKEVFGNKALNDPYLNDFESYIKTHRIAHKKKLFEQAR